MIRKNLLLFMLFGNLSACGALQTLNVLSDAKCKSVIATKDSKFTCEFEGRNLSKGKAAY